MSNPYQPTKLVDEGFYQDEPEASCFSLWMGILAAILATPLTSLFVIAVAFVLINLLGLDVDLDSLASEERFHRHLTIWAGVAAALFGSSAYFASRSANYFFAANRQKGGAYLFISLVISTLILVFICALPLLSLMLRDAM